MVSRVPEYFSGNDEPGHSGSRNAILTLSDSPTIDEQTEHTATSGLVKGKEPCVGPDETLGSPSPFPIGKVSGNMTSILSRAQDGRRMLAGSPGIQGTSMHDSMESSHAYVDGWNTCWEALVPKLRGLEKDREVLHRQHEEMVLEIKKLEEKVQELVEEKNRASFKKFEAILIKLGEKVVTESVTEKNKSNADPRNQLLVSGERQGTVPHSWVAPADGRIKINCSAALTLGGAAIGLGIVARDHTGRVLAWRQLYMPEYIEPTIAEALAVRESTMFAAAKRFRNVCIESECQTLVEILQHDMQEDQVEFGFVPPDCNSLARDLARKCTVSRDGEGEPT